MISKTIYLLPFLICLSCVDQLELQPAKGTEEGVTILGELVLGNPSIINVRINQLYNFEAQSYAPIPVRSVTLRDERGQTMNIPLRTSRLYQHVFDLSDPIKITEDQAYQIEVILQNGKHIISTYEALPATFGKEVNLHFKATRVLVQDIKGEINDVPIVQFSATTPTTTEDGQHARFFWTAERTYQITDSLDISGFQSKTCYITVNLDFDDIHLLDATDFTVDRIDSFPLSSVILNYEFAEGYYYTTYRKSLTENAFEYYSKMKETLERTGSLFDVPVGLLPSNLKNKNDEKDTNIYGYFMAYQQDTFRLYVAPEAVDEPDRLCPPRLALCPFVCCDCLVEPRSQLEKPDFWEE